ncbi:MAG TPA: hypothetical protein VFZ61_15345 [Polyangiales bacterium]
MPRSLAVSAASLTVALGIALACAAPAAAHRVDRAKRRPSLHSLAEFDRCQKEQTDISSEFCLDALKAFVAKHPQDAFEAGKLVRVYYMHWVALDFFVQALERGAPSPKQCRDRDVRSAVLAGLALPPHYPAVAQAQALLRGACSKQLSSAVSSQLRRDNGHLRGNACPLLTDKQSAARCRAAERSPSDDAAKPAELTTKAELLAKAPGLRETPPRRQEPPPSVASQRLTDVFPSVPGEPASASRAGLAELRMLDWRLLDVDAESAELLRGEHGEELLMARTSAKAHDYVLLKFKHIAGPWNERVLLALETRGSAGRDYALVQDGEELVVLRERQHQYQAFPQGLPGGLRLSLVRPNAQQALALPTRREIANEFAAAQATR